MRPLRRIASACSIDGATCVWCGQMILPGEQMTELRGQHGVEHWHAECEEASIACPELSRRAGPYPRPALPRQPTALRSHDAPDRTGIALGAAFAISVWCMVGVIAYGVWRAWPIFVR